MEVGKRRWPTALSSERLSVASSTVGELRAFGDWRGCLFGVCGLGSTGVLFFWIAPVAFTTRGRGLTFNFARVLARAPIDEPGFQPTDTEGPHNAVKSVLSCPMQPYRHRMCVIAEGLGCPHRLAHAAGSGHFFWRLQHLGAPVLIWTVHQQKCKTQIATTSRRETMFAARDLTHISRSPGRSQRAIARLKREVSKLAIITPQAAGTCLRHACFTPRRAPERNVQASVARMFRQTSGTLCGAQTYSMRK